MSGPVLGGNSDSVREGRDGAGSVELEGLGDFSGGELSEIGESGLGELESVASGDVLGGVVLGEVGSSEVGCEASSKVSDSGNESPEGDQHC